MSLKQDRTGTRTSEDLRRRLNVKGVDDAVKKVEINEQTVQNLSIDVSNLNKSLSNTRKTYVSTDNQSFTEEQKTRARNNIGAGNSSFSGSYSDLSNKPTSLSDINNTESTKLSGIEEGAEVNLIESISIDGVAQPISNKNVNLSIPNQTIDTSMSDYSTNAVQNKVIKEYVDSMVGFGVHEYSYSDSDGYIWFDNGFLIQWGRASITPTSANTDTTARITYTYTYTSTPDMKVSPVVATPSLVSVSCGGGTTTAQTKQGMNIYVNSTTTKAVNVNWLAVGHKSI